MGGDATVVLVEESIAVYLYPVLYVGWNSLVSDFPASMVLKGDWTHFELSQNDGTFSTLFFKKSKINEGKQVLSQTFSGIRNTFFGLQRRKLSNLAFLALHITRRQLFPLANKQGGHMKRDGGGMRREKKRVASPHFSLFICAKS